MADNAPHHADHVTPWARAPYGCLMPCTFISNHIIPDAADNELTHGLPDSWQGVHPAPESADATTMCLGLPKLSSQPYVTGATTPRLWVENKWRRRMQQLDQPAPAWWTKHMGHGILPPCPPEPTGYHNRMCPSGLATTHPTYALLHDYTLTWHTGPLWTREQLYAAIEYGSHVSCHIPSVNSHRCHQCICTRPTFRTNLHGKVGHKGWILALGLCTGHGMELRLHPSHPRR